MCTSRARRHEGPTPPKERQSEKTLTMNKHLSKITLVALLAGGLTTAAIADTMDLIVAPTGAAPVRINAASSDNPDDPYALYSYPLSVTIAFTNLNSVPAKDVVFGLRDSGRLVDEFTAVGTYSQGAAVRHDFRSSQLASPTLKSVQVDVEQATFADGSVWHQGDASPLTRRQAARSN
jgi:hypothetical protein